MTKNLKIILNELEQNYKQKHFQKTFDYRHVFNAHVSTCEHNCVESKSSASDTHGYIIQECKRTLVNGISHNVSPEFPLGKLIFLSKVVSRYVANNF